MGVLIALLAASCGTAKDIVSKKLSRTVNGTTSSWASFFFALPFYIVLLIIGWLGGFESFILGGQFLLLVLLRSLSDAGAEWCKMTALQYGDLSLVVIFFALAPLILVVISPLITGDVVSSQGALGVLVVVFGTIVALPPRKTIEPSSRPAYYSALGFALAAAACFALNSCFDRLAVQRSSPLLSGASMTLGALILLTPVMWRKGESRALFLYKGEFLLRGFFEVVFMVLKLTALMYLQAPYVAAIQKTSVIFSILGGAVFFGEEELLRRFIAGTLIVCGVIVIALYG